MYIGIYFWCRNTIILLRTHLTFPSSSLSQLTEEKLKKIFGDERETEKNFQRSRIVYNPTQTKTWNLKLKIVSLESDLSSFDFLKRERRKKEKKVQNGCKCTFLRMFEL